MKKVLTGLLFTAGIWYAYNKFVKPVPAVTPPNLPPAGGNLPGGGIAPPAPPAPPSGGGSNNNYIPSNPGSGGGTTENVVPSNDDSHPAPSGDDVVIPPNPIGPPPDDPFGANKGHAIGKISI